MNDINNQLNEISRQLDAYGDTFSNTIDKALGTTLDTTSKQTVGIGLCWTLIIILILICCCIWWSNNMNRGEHMTIDENINKMIGGNANSCKRKLFNTCNAPDGKMRIPYVDDACEFFVADLRGSEEVPANQSTGSGKVYLKLNDNTLMVSGDAGMNTPLGSNVTIGHIHVGDRGVAGPAVITLNLDNDGRRSTINTQKNTFTLTCEQVYLLRAGKYYVNIHSANFPDGEVRGQIVKANQ